MALALLIMAAAGLSTRADGHNQVLLPVIMDNPQPLPQALDDQYETLEDTLLSVDAAAGVLANDTHPDGASLQAQLVANVANGTLTLNPDGSFDYRPDPSFTGQDSFTYRATDGTLVSNIAISRIAITVVNSPPVAVDDQYQVFQNSVLDVDVAGGVLANDSDPEGAELTAMLVTNVANGQLALNLDGSFSYLPEDGFTGPDSFTYQASDGEALSNTATVTLTVSGVSQVNQPPQIMSGMIGFDKEVIGTRVMQTHAAEGGDFDCDGDIDVAATDYLNGRVVWYENDGNGNFTEKVLDDDLAGAYPAHAADVDGDGHMDVLAGGYLANTYVWYRNDCDGNFTRIVIDDEAAGAHSIVVVDLDQDGDNDFVVADQDAGEIGWYENEGNLNFKRHTIDTTAVKAKRAEVADMDGDGDLDVVTASYQVDEIAWFENDGSENFTKFKVNTTKRNGAYYASPADIDGQAGLDILTASKLDNTIAWYRSNGDGTFEENIIDDTAEGARTVLGVDLDRDGDIDALATSREDDTVAWYENDGQGNFTTHLIDTEAGGAYGVSYIDIDFDGDLDLLVAARVSHEVIVYTQFQAMQTSVPRGGTLLIDESILLTEDADDGPDQLTYELLTLPGKGELQLGGVALGNGDTFTQQQLNDGLLTYVHDGSQPAPDSFRFSVRDGGESGVQPPEGLFLIDVVRP